MKNNKKKMAERTGLEPATSGVTGQHSNQLNYRSATCSNQSAWSGSVKAYSNFSTGVSEKKHFLCKHKKARKICGLLLTNVLLKNDEKLHRFSDFHSLVDQSLGSTLSVR